MDPSTVHHSLEERIAGGPCPPRQVMDWARKLCEALESLHARQILARPHPARILIDADGGLCMLPPAPEVQVTPGYTCLDPHEDGCSDVYALGAILYALLTGTRPPAASDRVALDLPPASRTNPDVTPALDALVARALQPDRHLRYGSIAEVRQALAVAVAEDMLRPGPLVRSPAQEQPPVAMEQPGAIDAALHATFLLLAIALPQVSLLLVGPIVSLGLVLSLPPSRRVPWLLACTAGFALVYWTWAFVPVLAWLQCLALRGWLPRRSGWLVLTMVAALTPTPLAAMAILQPAAILVATRRA